MFRKILSATLLLIAFLGVPAHAQFDLQARGMANQALITRTWKNLSEFGVKYGAQTDQSAAVNAAFASGYAINCTGTVYFSNTLVLSNGLTLQGNGSNATAVSTPHNPGCLFQVMPGMTADAVHMPVGVVIGLLIRDVQFNGVPANTGQNGLILAAQQSAGVTGGQAGLWQSMVENVSITSFDGISLALIGNCNTDIAPHQYINFKSITIYRAASTSGAALYATGQVEHIHFDSSQFDNGGAGIGGTDIYLGRPYGATCTGIGPYGTGTVFSGGQYAPIDWKFTNTSTQSANQAVIVDGVQQITFESHWAEENNNFLLAQVGSRVTVKDSNLPDSMKNGYLVNSTGCSEVFYQNNRGGSTGTALGFNTDGCGGIVLSGIVGNATLNNLVWTIGYSGPNLNLDVFAASGLYLLCTASGTSISGLNSDLAPGSTFEIKVQPSSAYPCTLNSTGASSNAFSLNLGNGVSTVTLNQGDTALFMRSAFAGSGWEYLGKH